MNANIFSDFFGKQNIKVEESLNTLNELLNYIANNSFNFINVTTNQFFENKPLIEIIFERFIIIIIIINFLKFNFLNL
jgi:hypothetical protein